MKSFQLFRNASRSGSPAPSAWRAAANSEFSDSKPLPPPPDTHGWFDSSADLKCGLQVQEEDFDSLPDEYRAVFASR